MHEKFPLVLTLTAAGTPQRWCTFEESAYYYAKGLVAWSVGEEDFTIYGGTSRITGTQSSMTMNTIIAIKGNISAKQMARANSVPLTNRTLFQRDKQICAYCGNNFKVDDLSRDHIIPTSKGGKNIWTNVVTACCSCNRVKDDRTPEGAGMQLLYVPYSPNRAEALILQNRKILGSQMDFLIKQVPKESRLLQ